MNAKVHIPKNLKMGFTMKQFLLSLVATTISIVLTFGTAAWLDGKKNEKAKREMVMMILYDLAGNIEQVEQCDSILRWSLEQQIALAENPDLLKQQPFLFMKIVPYIDLKYTNTVEHIFSSNIETINTLGNVLFAENVSQIYQLRNSYQETICDSIMKKVQEGAGLMNYDQIMGIEFTFNIMVGGSILSEMKEKFAQCKQMMDVSDADLDTYCYKREEMAQKSAAESIQKALQDEMLQNDQRLQAAKEKGKKQNR